MGGRTDQFVYSGRGYLRGENEWPLARTDWRKLSLTGDLLTENAGPPGERGYTMTPGTQEARRGEPKLVFRTEAFVSPTEITGPMALYLTATSDMDNTDWFVFIKDESPDGSFRLLTRGMLRATHRALGPEKSRPWHPHTEAEPVPAGEAVEYVIDIIPTCNLFLEGHCLRVEISSYDSDTDLIYTHEPIPQIVTNTVHTGESGSYLLVPFIPR